jgi:hypothetical protein
MFAPLTLVGCTANPEKLEQSKPVAARVDTFRDKQIKAQIEFFRFLNTNCITGDCREHYGRVLTLYRDALKELILAEDPAETAPESGPDPHWSRFAELIEQARRLTDPAWMVRLSKGGYVP